jgi:origin recognition complex subunit 5
MYINDADAIQTTIAVIDNVLNHLSSAPGPSKISYARADAIACFSARLLYESVINSLASWTPQWEDGAVIWGVDNEVRWNDTFDGFVHGLRAVHAYLGKGKKEEGDMRLVVVVERAERLIPELMLPLTRLAELVSSSLSLLEQLTFFGRPESTFVSYLSQRPHGRRCDHRWARLPTRIFLTFLPQRKKVRL